MSGGKLFVVATPIGNLSDITFRAVEILRSVAWVAAEDTRHTGRLLSHLGISARLMSLHDHNEEEKSEVLLEKLVSGDDIALVSDAGTPLISDPGYILVRKAKKAGVEVLAVPGPCALIAALSVSGISSQKFSFEGFIPVKKNAKMDLLKQLGESPVTSVFYESTHRIVETLDMMEALYPDRLVCLARELTKQYETVLTGSVSALKTRLDEDPQQCKGEFVVVLDSQPKVKALFAEEHQRLLARLLSALPPKEACAIVADHYSLDKKQLYKWSIGQIK